MVAKNYTSRARSKAIVDYLLSGKLYCGHCNGHMIGISGTSKSGKKHYYYECTTHRDRKTCDKVAERKDDLENIVVKTIVEKVLTDENIELIATNVMKLIEEDSADNREIKYYEDELKDTQKRIKNLVDLMEQGVSTTSTKNRLLELESYEKDVLSNIEFVKMKKPTLTKEQIIYWLELFKDGDINDMEYKRKLINTLLHSVYVYDKDDGGKRIVLNFNTSNNSSTEVECSFIGTIAPPTSLKTNTICIINYSVFAYVFETESAR